ncbi:MAG: hypothetical protein MMC23_009007 [Stictis urceolatum]|nr:hypothetical protein [Stictis urceolata]
MGSEISQPNAKDQALTPKVESDLNQGPCQSQKPSQEDEMVATSETSYNISIADHHQDIDQQGSAGCGPLNQSYSGLVKALPIRKSPKRIKTSNLPIHSINMPLEPHTPRLARQKMGIDSSTTESHSRSMSSHHAYDIAMPQTPTKSTTSASSQSPRTPVSLLKKPMLPPTPPSTGNRVSKRRTAVTTQRSRNGLSNPELRRLSQFMATKIDWQYAAEYVASNRRPSVYKQAVIDLFDVYMSARNGMESGEMEQNVEYGLFVDGS